jgi:hypothetical protein
MMEVNVVFFENGFPAFDFYSSGWVERSIERSYYQPILLK